MIKGGISMKGLLGTLSGSMGLLVAVFAGGTIVVPAFAQPPLVAAASTPVTDNSGRLEEIIVTARKREENLQSVPIAITALTADDIRAENIISPMDLKNNT